MEAINFSWFSTQPRSDVATNKRSRAGRKIRKTYTRRITMSKRNKRKIVRTITNVIRKTINTGLALASLFAIFKGFGYIDADSYVKGLILCGIGLAYLSVFLHMNPQLKNMNQDGQ